MLNAITAFPDHGIVRIPVFVLRPFRKSALGIKGETQTRKTGLGSRKSLLLGKSVLQPRVRPSEGRKEGITPICTNPKLYTYPVVLLSEEFLAQSILLLLLPLLRQEILNRGVSAQEGAAVAPDGRGGVGLGHLGGVPGVPEGLGGFDFLVSGFEREGRFVLGHDGTQLLTADGVGRDGGERGDWRLLQGGRGLFG